MPAPDLDGVRDVLGIADLTLSRIDGGQSNLTFAVTSPSTGERWVVRTPPPGAAPGAHDIAREYRVVKALHDSRIPVPRAVALRQGDVPFAVYGFVVGTPHRTPEVLSALGRDRTAGIVRSCVDTLVELHSIAPRSVGLTSLGRPEGFLVRQVRRWGGSTSLAAAAALHDELMADVPDSADEAIVHGDYRLDNVLIHNDRVVTVLDWEMCTTGDPLTDLGLLLAHRNRRAGAIANPASARGFPTAEEMASRYAECSGRDLTRIRWYEALGFLKLAAIATDVHRRTADPDYALLAASAAEQGRETLEND